MERMIWIVVVLALVMAGGYFGLTSIGLQGPLYTFNAVEGRVLNQGQPMAGAVVERRTRQASTDAVVETVETSPDGRFAFPEAQFDSFFTRVLPHQPVVTQEIMIRVDGQRYDGWFHTKFDYKREFDGAPLRFECELTRDPEDNPNGYGICILINDLDDPRAS